MSKLKFRITEMKTAVTFMYMIQENTNGNSINYTLEKLDSTKEVINGYDVRTFYSNSPGNLIVVSMWDNKYIVNGGLLTNTELEISTKPKGVIYGKVETSSDEEYFTYSPSEERKVFLIDLEKQVEVESQKLVENNNEYLVCKLEPGKKYLAIEYRHGSARTVATGICKFEKVDGKYEAVMNDNEVKRVDYDLIIDEIDKGNKLTVPVTREMDREL